MLVLVAFLAAFTQGLTGFGSALVAMAVLPGLLGIRVAAPLVALMAGTARIRSTSARKSGPTGTCTGLTPK